MCPSWDQSCHLPVNNCQCLLRASHGVLGREDPGGLPHPSLPEQQLEGVLVASQDQAGEGNASSCSHKYSPSLLARLQCSLFSDAVTYSNVFLPPRLLPADICLNVGPVGLSKSRSADCTDLVPPCAAEATPASRAGQPVGRPAATDPVHSSQPYLDEANINRSSCEVGEHGSAIRRIWQMQGMTLLHVSRQP